MEFRTTDSGITTGENKEILNYRVHEIISNNHECFEENNCKSKTRKLSSKSQIVFDEDKITYRHSIKDKTSITKKMSITEQKQLGIGMKNSGYSFKQKSLKDHVVANLVSSRSKIIFQEEIELHDREVFLSQQSLIQENTCETFEGENLNGDLTATNLRDWIVFKEGKGNLYKNHAVRPEIIQRNVANTLLQNNISKKMLSPKCLNNDKKKIQCNNCDKMFLNKTCFKEHNCLDIKIFACDYCKQKFYTRSQIVYHIRNIHMKFLCKTNELKSINSQHKHAKEKLSKKSHKGSKTLCDICGIKFSGNLMEHIKKVHSKRNVIDFKCGKSYIQRSDNEMYSSAHSTTAIQIKLWSCKFCKQEFKYKFNCTRHEKKYCLHRNNLRFTCDICQKVYHKNDTLSGHNMKIHPTARNSYLCDVCSKKEDVCTKTNSYDRGLKVHVLKYLNAKHTCNKVDAASSGILRLLRI